MSEDKEWEIYTSKRQKQVKKQVKKHEQSDIDIPLLLKVWPNAMNEIILYIRNEDLLKLRKTSRLMKEYCDKEIAYRQLKGIFWLKWLESIHRKYVSNYYDGYDYERAYYYKHEYYNHLLFCDNECHQKKNYYEINSEKYIRIYKYLYDQEKKHVGDGYDSKIYDPNCPGKERHNYWIQKKKAFEKELIQETEIDILLNPKLKCML